MGLYFRHPSSLAHDTGGHPECAERITALERGLDAAGWPALTLHEATAADRGQIGRVHTERHIDTIERICSEGGGMIDNDTVAVPASWEAALHAAGAAGEAAERLLSGEGEFAFCGMRPPGHHAESDRAMGFCLFNSIAVGAAHAIAETSAERVLILDWDVHHGNGTAEIFAARNDVLYASIHQSPLYPGTGHPREIGSGAGEGFTVNLPVAAGADGELFAALCQHVIVPIARQFEPDLLAISAGFDAHADDPLADCLLRDADYATMAAGFRDLGRELGAPVLVCLEGGYDLEALAGSALACVRGLSEEIDPPVADPALAAPARRLFAGSWSSLA